MPLSHYFNIILFVLLFSCVVSFISVQKYLSFHQSIRRCTSVTIFGTCSADANVSHSCCSVCVLTVRQRLDFIYNQ